MTNLPTMVRTEVVYNGQAYPAIELYDFDTADGYNIDYGVFADESLDIDDDDSLSFRILDNGVYGYLSADLLTNGTEEQIRKHIKENIG